MGEALVVGIVIGGVYGLFALGLVLIYKGSGAINFAQAEIGTMTLFLCHHLVTARGVPYLGAALLSILAGALIAIAFERFAVWPLRGSSTVVLTIATVALLAFLTASEITLFGGNPRVLDTPLASGVSIGGVVVSGMQFLSLGLVIAIGIGLALFLRQTDFGLAVVAAADDQEAVRFLGIPLARVSMFVWAFAGALSSVAALLILPSVGALSPSSFNVLFIKALAAALIGGLTNMRGAFLGGLIVGIVEAEIRYMTLGSPLIGLPEVAVFGAAVAVLVLRPRGIFEAAAR